MLEQQHGKRQSLWDHTATLAFVMQRVAGNKNAKFFNPYAAQEDQKAAFKKLFQKEND